MRQVLYKERPLQNAPFRRLAQILILEILYVFLWLKFSPSLNLNEIEHFSKVSRSAVVIH
jgi:hypothetical protein